ncbi:hypothetical protein RN001_010064 [Aquatica leii]|uniref:Uncharacterized protein n=1 Tax=Aquatica leii TaxID=1421715 RepID=A0AAN7SN56_9COLE|nr:hypothetical protein RN001_010064 [Aquatica leii]
MKISLIFLISVCVLVNVQHTYGATDMFQLIFNIVLLCLKENPSEITPNDLYQMGKKLNCENHTLTQTKMCIFFKIVKLTNEQKCDLLNFMEPILKKYPSISACIKNRLLTACPGLCNIPNVCESNAVNLDDVMTASICGISKRLEELPSIRSNLTGNNTLKYRSLRITDASRSGSLPRDLSKEKKQSSAFIDNKPMKSIRRVRFDLPPTDGNTNALDADAESVIKQTAGDDLHLTTRAVSQRPDILKHCESQFLNTQRILKNEYLFGDNSVFVTKSPGLRHRVHPTGRYIRGTLSPTVNSAAPAAASPGGVALLRAARDGDDTTLKDILRKSVLVGIPQVDLNAVDNSGRTALSYVASNGSLDLLDLILQLPNLDPNHSDNEGNTPLHFAAQAGQVECLNVLLSRCKGIEIDARNNLGFTPLMKAALQGRNKCAKLLLFAGANPTLRDSGRGLRADQWARFCGRYVCADVIEKHARQRLLERSTSYGNWGGENDIGAKVLLGKVVPVPQISQQQHGIKSRLKKVFRTSSGPSPNMDNSSSARLVTQLTTAALCASSPILPSAPSVPPVIKSLIRPLTVPRLQVTLVNNNNDEYQSNNYTTNGNSKTDNENKEQSTIIKQSRSKKKK